ncbi:MAG: biotin transporter BioY [Treponema sp.]|nr:biotin transporter BioY [Treponema sp.]
MKLSTLRSTFTALFAALICVGTFISIPLPGGVPITVQNMFAILGACVLGGIHGAGAVGIFITLGGLGLHVFSGMTGGIGIIAGPTGGFFIGYFIGALAAGLIAGTPSTLEKRFRWKTWLRLMAASAVGFTLVYVPAIPWFISVMASRGKSVDIQTALSWTLVPFIPGDVIKCIVTVPLAAVLRPVVARYLHPADEDERMFNELKQRLEKEGRL